MRVDATAGERRDERCARAGAAPCRARCRHRCDRRHRAARRSAIRGTATRSRELLEDPRACFSGRGAQAATRARVRRRVVRAGRGRDRQSCGVGADAARTGSARACSTRAIARGAAAERRSALSRGAGLEHRRARPLCVARLLEVGRRRDYYRRPVEDALVLRLELPARSHQLTARSYAMKWQRPRRSVGASSGLALYSVAARTLAISPGGISESQLEQGHPDRQPRRRSRGPLHHRRQSRRHVLARHQPHWNGPSGEKQEKTEWHRCVVWNSKTSHARRHRRAYLKKGDKVYVEGRIEYRQWQDKENQTRYSTEINVRELIMSSGRAGGCRGIRWRQRGRRQSRPRAAATDRSRGAGPVPAGAGGDFEDFRGQSRDGGRRPSVLAPAASPFWDRSKCISGLGLDGRAGASHRRANFSDDRRDPHWPSVGARDCNRSRSLRLRIGQQWSSYRSAGRAFRQPRPCSRSQRGLRA